MHEAGEEDEDVGVFGADPDLEAGGENAVLLGSLFPSDKTVNFGDLGDGVLDGFTKVVMLTVNKTSFENPQNFNNWVVFLKFYVPSDLITYIYEKTFLFIEMKHESIRYDD